jgi:ATP-dependent exoDNAse (exonuclease V) alpha subunit
VDPERLLRGWNALIQLKGLELPTIPQLHQEKSSHSESPGIFIQTAIQHCSERESVFKQTHLERFVLEHHLGEQSFEQLEQAIAHNAELIQIDDNKYTTQSALNLELNTIRLMQNGKGQVSEIAAIESVNAHLENKSLTVGQQDAIQLASTTNDQFIVWQGVAGSGKTFALSEFSAIAQAQGYSVRGFAPSAEAAHGLGKTLQIETKTVAGLLVAQKHGDKRQPEIWIVDEAGLLSMREAHDLLNLAKAEKARVILVGDTKQLSSVAAGNPFKSLQAGGMATARLDETLRQQTQELRAAVNQVAQGKVVEGIQTLAATGCIQEIPKNEERSQQMVEDYLRLSAEERQRTLLLAGTHQARWELTQKIRQGLQAEEALGPDTVTVNGLRPKDLTVAQAAYSSAYAPGDIVVPNQDYKKQGLVKNQQYRVLAGDRTNNQLLLETPSGQVITVDPA